MNICTLPALCPANLLFLTNCKNGAPPQGGYAIVIASSSEILLVHKQSGGGAGAKPNRSIPKEGPPWR